ncbi:MAG: cytochrome b N-terminal domain-containing protein, partial [Anaerolineae bacterium]|nr:cytochrome b N-terminal domain-containing protein [Anaerolineae bacterium]
MSDQLDPRPENLPQRVWESIQRDELPPRDDRDRMRYVMNNLVLHLHPSKVARPTLKFTYTFGLGGLALLLIALLAVTGVMLMFEYTPSPDTAYLDMLRLQTEVNFGQLVRNIHHWSGNLMVVVVFLHLLRVFFTGGFRFPREFNWVLGLSLLVLVVGANFTGYLLPWDQLAYWAVTVGSSLLSYIPLIGEGLRNFLLGGPDVGAATLTNFYGLHVAIIPLTLLGIASFHIWRVRKDTLSVPRRLDQADAAPAPVEKVTTLPHLVSRELVFALIMTGLILLWSVWVNAPLEAAANPDHSPNPAKAAWYFMGLQELLLHFHPVFGAIIIPGLAFAALILLPYSRFDLDAEGIWFRSRKGRRMALFGAITALIATPALVLLDEYVLDLPALLPSLPTALSNGWVPLAALLLLLVGYYEGVKRLFRSAGCEARLSLFTLLVVAFVVLTVIGIFFRGEGMALMWPWE